MKNALILLAGGVGKRFKDKEPKQFLKIGNKNIIEYFLSNLDSKIFDIIVIAIKNKDRIKYSNLLRKKFKNHNIKFVKSGETRQISSRHSLNFLKKFQPENVLIHDSARPLVTNKLVKKILNSLIKNYSSIPYVIQNDLIKIKNGINLNNINVDNKNIFNIQTPQGFHFNEIYKAHKISKTINAKDDSVVLENYGIKLNMLKGEISNIKITTQEDILYFKKLKFKEFRSGIGYDIHKIDFSSKKKLKLCGVKINHPPLLGHSDADVGYHAVCDSILGSLSMKDIGYYFNNKNLKWKDANSKIFIKFCNQALVNKGYEIVNLDINFICETPNIKKISNLMKENLSKLLNTPIKRISIKATTNEKINFINKGEGIAAESIIQIRNV